MARILVANDDADLLELCQEVLEGDHHVVETVANGRIAIERALSWRPDLIVVDWVMPEIDGCSAVRAMRRDPTIVETPILMMSGSDKAWERALEAGASAFLEKPFTPDDLVAAVRELLQRSAHDIDPRAGVVLD